MQPVECPHCLTLIDVKPLGTEQYIACPACGDQLTVPVLTDDAVELDEARIRRVASARRAAVRSRSHLLIATVAAAVIAVQAGWLCVRLGIQHQWAWSLLAALITVSCTWGACHFLGRWIELRRDSGASEPAESSTPDFSSLGDGSQLAERLRQLHD